MVDYYSILSKAVNNSPSIPTTSKMRLAIYHRAAKALRNQMNSFRPPPSEAFVRNEIRQLASAIEKIEEQLPEPLKNFNVSRTFYRSDSTEQNS